MNHSFLVGRERRNPDVDRVPTAFRQDPKEEIPMWGKYQSPRDHPVFFTVGSVFSLLRAGFSPRLSVENRLDPLYIETNYLYF